MLVSRAGGHHRPDDHRLGRRTAPRRTSGATCSAWPTRRSTPATPALLAAGPRHGRRDQDPHPVLRAVHRQIYPVKPGASHDPVLRALAPVGCKNAAASTPTTAAPRPGGRPPLVSASAVKPSPPGWGVPKSAAATSLWSSVPRCPRAYAAGSARPASPSPAPPPARACWSSTACYGNKAGAHYAWLGGPSWTDAAVNGDGITLRVPYEETLRAYLKAFSLMWQRG